MKIFIFLSFIFYTLKAFSQINPKNITILRDSLGVPYIYAKTDAEVAYGLAWANAEDDFVSMQENLLNGKAMLGLYQGKQGAGLDFIVRLFKIREYVNQNYETQVSPDFKKVLQGYAEGVNAYAKKYPQKVLIKNAFPITPQDILSSYVTIMTLFSQAPFIVQRILDGTIKDYKRGFRFRMTIGSNAIAINSNKSDNQHVFLAINSHQPLEGRFSWYEAELHSEEGWNIHGGLFPGGTGIFLGYTPNLAWAHTFNLPDICDHFLLTINPQNKNQYQWDGQWIDLEEHIIPLKVKIAGITITVKKKAWWSKIGPVIQGKDGNYYAIKAPASTEIRIAEQWFRMNKAQNLKDFQDALKIHAAALFNVIYADRFENIYYHHLGLIPIREKGYDWNQAVPGNSSKLLWKEYYPLEKLPHYLNPDCGYLFNTNNTACFASCESNNLKINDFDETMGLECYINNRAQRLFELIQPLNKISWQDFKRIKYDICYSTHSTFVKAIKNFWDISPQKYPDIQDIIKKMQNFDFCMNRESSAASLWGLTLAFLIDKKNYSSYEVMGGYMKFSEQDYIEGIHFSINHLKKYFKTTEVKWGDLFRHRRGKIDLPFQGGPEVLAAGLPKMEKDGRLKNVSGESLIMLIDYNPKDGTHKAYTINAYGSSADPKSPHYTDQMQPYVQQQTRLILQGFENQKKYASKIYSPEP
ncbi:MAG: penicillin amidase [Bacteroidia bacterium]|nr:MAG: penicillin amidase [Bacteroidia bacterium]